MKKMIAALTGTVLGVAMLAAVSASPEQISPVHGPHHQVSRQSGPFDRAGELSIGSVRVGMARDQIKISRVSPEYRPTDLKFDRDSHVCFVAGTYLSQGSKPIGNSYEPIDTMHNWGKPAVQGTCGQYVVAVYRAGLSLVILRYEPASLDRRAGTVGEFAVTSDVAWVPYDWGHALIENAHL